MYVDQFHRMVAEIDLGIYNWKQHSTGYILKELRNTYMYAVSYGSSEWFVEYEIRLRDELAKRPHLPNRKDRKRK